MTKTRLVGLMCSLAGTWCFRRKLGHYRSAKGQEPSQCASLRRQSERRRVAAGGFDDGRFGGAPLRMTRMRAGRIPHVLFIPTAMRCFTAMQHHLPKIGRRRSSSFAVNPDGGHHVQGQDRRASSRRSRTSQTPPSIIARQPSITNCDAHETAAHHAHSAHGHSAHATHHAGEASKHHAENHGKH